MTGDPQEPELSVSALKYHHGGPCVVISLAGRAGIADCTWVRLLLEMQAAQGRGRLVVDLSGLSSMDWWVALMLIWASRVISRRGGVLELASPQPAVAQLLDAAGVGSDDCPVRLLTDQRHTWPQRGTKARSEPRDFPNRSGRMSSRQSA